MVKTLSCLEHVFSNVSWIFHVLLNIPYGPVPLSQPQWSALNGYVVYAQLTELSAVICDAAVFKMSGLFDHLVSECFLADSEPLTYWLIQIYLNGDLFWIQQNFSW